MHLRALEPEDLPYLYRWENDAAAWADGATHNPLSRQQLRDYIAQQTGDIFRDGQLRLIIEGDEGETLGIADLFDLEPVAGRAAIGLYIAPEVRGKGVGYEALRQLCDYAFGFLRLHQVYSVIADDNAGCGAMHLEAGFRAVAPLTDWVMRDGRYVAATLYQKIAPRE